MSNVFSNYLIMLLGAITSEKTLYTTDPLRPSHDPYSQATFIEIQTLLIV